MKDNKVSKNSEMKVTINIYKDLSQEESEYSLWKRNRLHRKKEKQQEYRSLAAGYRGT